MLLFELSVIVGDIHPCLLNQHLLPIISNLSYICVICTMKLLMHSPVDCKHR